MTGEKKAGVRYFAKFRSRHPYAASAIRNVALTGAAIAPLAIASGRGFSHIGETLKGVRAISRGVDRGAGLALLRAGKPELRRVLNRSKRLEQAAYIGGIPAGVLAVGSPLERWDYHRREIKREGQRPLHRTLVVSHRKGAMSAHRALYS